MRSKFARSLPRFALWKTRARLVLVLVTPLLVLNSTGCSGLISRPASSAPGSLTANPATLTFGDVTVGSNSVLSTTLTNAGVPNVTVSGVTASSSAYLISGVPGGTTLSSGQSAVLTVTFKPSAVGKSNGFVTISSNAANSPSIVVTGAGLSATPPSVALSWTAPASTQIGYYIYRGSSISGPYAKLNLVSATQFTDLSVQSGQTYTYVVTAVDSNFAESSYSNPATATIP